MCCSGRQHDRANVIDAARATARKPPPQRLPRRPPCGCTRGVQLMVDYKAWGTVDPIAVEDAAYLWAGIDPSTYSFTLTAEQRGAFTARLKMLTVRIQSKTLSAKIDSNPAAFIGVHDKSLVTRADLRVVAEALGERPAFLFFNEPLEGHSTAVARPDSELVYSRDGQHRAMHKQAIEALSHRPISPRRVSNAPPPPPTVGGGGAVWAFPPKDPEGAKTEQSSGTGASTGSSLAEAADITRLTKEILARRERGDFHHRDAMRLWTKREIRHMTSDEADALYYRVPEEIRKSSKQGRPRKQKSGQTR